MEEKDSLMVSGVAVSSEQSQDIYRIAPRTEIPLQSVGPTMAAAATAPPMSSALTGTESMKKKRGRPRKYGTDKTSPASALSPMPISSSVPLTGEFSAWKRGRGRPVDSVKKSHKYDVFESSGNENDTCKIWVLQILTFRLPFLLLHRRSRFVIVTLKNPCMQLMDGFLLVLW